MSARNRVGDFPGGPVVKNLPRNAGDAGSILGGGTKIPHRGLKNPHAGGQLNPCATVKTQHSQKKERERERNRAGFEPQFLHLPRLSTALPYKRMAGQAPRSRHGISDWQDSNLKC